LKLIIGVLLSKCGGKNSFYNKTHTKKTIEKISKTTKATWGNGKPPPIMHGKNNPSTKKRIFISPTGKKYEVYGIKNFCKKHNLSLDKVKKFMDKGRVSKPTDKKTISRQREKSKNTIGWEFITI